MFDLGAIEQGIKDAVKALNRSYIAEIKTYGGEFDVGDERDFAQVVSKFPAVWTTFAGSGRPEPRGAKKWHIPLTFTVLVGARSIRTEETARHGVTVNGEVKDVGTFQLLRDVYTALCGKKLGLAINPFEPGKIGTIFNTKTEREAASVLSFEWNTSVLVCTPNPEEDAADWLERVNVDYLFQPDDDVPDVSDVIELQP